MHAVLNGFFLPIFQISSSFSKSGTAEGRKIDDASGLTESEIELIRDVFFMLKMPFDIDADKGRISLVLNRRKRKIGVNNIRRQRF